MRVVHAAIPREQAFSARAADAVPLSPRTKHATTAATVPRPAEPDYKFKIVVVGDPAVGKTSLIRRYVFGTFDGKRTRSLHTQVSTRGAFVDLSYLGLTLSRRRDPLAMSPREGGAHIDMLVWDILGHSRKRMREKDGPYQGARGVVAVADLTRAETLDALDGWIEDVYDVTGPIATLLVANKLDLRSEAVLTEEEVARAAWAFDCPYRLASAKTGVDVEVSFQSLAERIYLDILARKLE